jgi:hypothetical protein
MAEEKRQAPQASSASSPGRDQTTPTDKESGNKDSLEARIRDLEATVVAQRAAMPMSVTPEHGAGDGMDVAETWSQAEQEAAIAEDDPETR